MTKVTWSLASCTIVKSRADFRFVYSRRRLYLATPVLLIAQTCAFPLRSAVQNEGSKGKRRNKVG